MDEVATLLSALPTDMALLFRLLYGTGMRLMGGLSLRVKDVDFDRRVVVEPQANVLRYDQLREVRSVACKLKVARFPGVPGPGWV